MRIYPEELRAYALYKEEQLAGFPLLTAAQVEALRAKAALLRQWQNAHKAVHNAINSAVLLAILGLIGFLVYALPSMVRLSTAEVALVAFAYGYLAYGLTNFSLHEGAGHQNIILKIGPISGLLQKIANNLCRLNAADPAYYRTKHPAHHARTATEGDGTFTQFVWPKRFWLSVIPFAGTMPFCDYKIHSGDEKTRSGLLSDATSAAFAASIIVSFLVRGYSIGSVLVFLTVAIWSAFTLDRLRETTEHNLMPDTPYDVARSFGPGFWGLLVGGGPWGQPCHLVHHLAPAACWYHQILLHFELKRILTPEQREVFLVKPVLGYPCLLVRILRQNLAYARRIRQDA
jgi:fatty acid desaturase